MLSSVYNNLVYPALDWSLATAADLAMEMRAIVGPGAPGTLNKPNAPERPDKIALDGTGGRFPRMGENERRKSFSGEQELIDLTDQPQPQQRKATTFEDLGVTLRPRASLIADHGMENLNKKLEALNVQLRIERERAEKAEAERDSLIAMAPVDLAETVQENKALHETINSLKTELEDARSHIFALQPYRKDPTPEEVGREYDELVSGITEWVEKFMDPILDDEKKQMDVSLVARKHPEAVRHMKKYIQENADLFNGMFYPETDVDICVAIIMRFVHEKIFQRVLYGSVNTATNVLRIIEKSMQNNVTPKRDLFAQRSWQAETYNALLSCTEIVPEREKHVEMFAGRLVDMFRVMLHDRDIEWFYRNFKDKCIRPAIALQEKFTTSTNHFYFDLNSYMIYNQRRTPEVNPDFYLAIQNDQLAAANIFQARRKFVFEKLSPKPTMTELRNQLANVVAVAPSLWMRQIGRGDAIKEPTIVRKQQLLVGYATPEKKRAFIDNGEKTLMYRIFVSNSGRSEHTLRELGFFSSFSRMG